MATKKEIEKELNTLTNIVLDLANEVKELSVKLQPSPIAEEKSINEAPKVPEIPLQQPDIPSEFTNIVKTVLNQKFGIQIKYLTDSPAFEFIISVPREYSNAGQPHWETYKQDLRPKVISNSEGIIGVKAWVEKVFNNFNQDTRTLIVLERAN